MFSTSLVFYSILWYNNRIRANCSKKLGGSKMNTHNIAETHQHKVLFKPQGVLAFAHSILPSGGILKLEKNGIYACACFDNVIDYNTFRTKLSCVTSV